MYKKVCGVFFMYLFLSTFVVYMGQLTLWDTGFFAEFIPEPAGNRRRSRTQPVRDEELLSRRDRINKRNRLVAARYYYWTEIQRRRFDDVLHILSDEEFFVDSRTISNVLVEENDYLSELTRGKTTKRHLKSIYPSFCWD